MRLSAKYKYLNEIRFVLDVDCGSMRLEDMILKRLPLPLICSSVDIFVVEFAYGILSTHNIRHKISFGKSPLS